MTFATLWDCHTGQRILVDELHMRRVVFGFWRQFLAYRNMTIVTHLPYSNDLTTFDFFLFIKMKIKLKGRRFDTAEGDSGRTGGGTDNADTQKSDCIRLWKKRWHRYVHYLGNYFNFR